MSEKSWKPTRLGTDNTESTSAAIVVELAVKTEAAKEVFESTLASQGEFRIKQPKETTPPQLLILELDEEPEKTFELIRTILSSSKSIEIFLTSSRTDSSTLLEVLRAGVKEFIPQPIKQEELASALERSKARLLSQHSEHTAKTTGEVLCVFGGKGGVGSTSVAVNLAASLQNTPGRPSVALVDINQHGGDLPLYLDLQTSHSFRDIGADISRLDTNFLARILTKHESGLQVLPCGYDDLNSGRLSPDCVLPTLVTLQALFDYIVIDCGHVLDLATKKAMELASSILVVTQLVVPVVHRTKRVLDLIKGSGFKVDKLKLIVNRYTTNEKSVLSETEEVIKHKAFWLLPNDYMAVSHAINDGKPLVHMNSRNHLAKSYQDLAGSFMQTPTSKNGKSGSFLASCLKAFKRDKAKQTAA